MPPRAPTNIQRYSKAVSLQASMRGEYIIGEALYHAIKALEHMQDRRTIDDMQLLMEELYPLYNISMKAQEKAEVKDD